MNKDFRTSPYTPTHVFPVLKPWNRKENNLNICKQDGTCWADLLGNRIEVPQSRAFQGGMIYKYSFAAKPFGRFANVRE